jgi:dihydrofolate reductase
MQKANLMNNPIEVSAIVAVDDKYGMGKGGTLPWHDPIDMHYFRDVTYNSICIMGRKTYEDINRIRGGKTPLLNDRHCIVVTETLAHSAVPNANVVKSVTGAYNHALYIMSLNGDKYNYNKIFFLGGPSIYKAALPRLNKIYLNKLSSSFDCDIFFPVEILTDFTIISENKLSSTLTGFVYQK